MSTLENLKTLAYVSDRIANKVKITPQELQKLLALVDAAEVMRTAIEDEVIYQMAEYDNSNGGLLMAVRPWDKAKAALDGEAE